MDEPNRYPPPPSIVVKRRAPIDPFEHSFVTTRCDTIVGQFTEEESATDMSSSTGVGRRTAGRSAALPGGQNWAAMPLVVAVTGLGEATMINWGDLSVVALEVLLVSLAVAVLAMSRRFHARGTPIPRSAWVVAIVTVGLTDLRYGNPDGLGVRWLPLLISVALVAAATLAAWLPARVALPTVGLTGVLWCALLAVTWGPWGRASIDVFNVVSGATAHLLHGGNPYGPVFQYTQLVTTTRWGLVNGHFAYGPLVPILAAPGWLFGDVRLMSAVAVAATAAALWWLARQGPQRESAHRLLLLAVVSPFFIHMIEEAWVEVYVVAGIVGWLALRNRHRWASIGALAVSLLVSPLAVPLLVPALLWSRRARREIASAVAIAIVVALPFILMTGAGAFLYDVLGFQMAMRPRFDALTVTSYVWNIWAVTLPGWLAVAVGLLAVLLVAARGRPRGGADLPLQAALVLWVPLIVAKWAYFNYYFLCAAMLLAAMAVWGTGLPAEDVALPRWRSKPVDAGIPHLARRLGGLA